MGDVTLSIKWKIVRQSILSSFSFFVAAETFNSVHSCHPKLQHPYVVEVIEAEFDRVAKN